MFRSIVIRFLLSSEERHGMRHRRAVRERYEARNKRSIATPNSLLLFASPAKHLLLEQPERHVQHGTRHQSSLEAQIAAPLGHGSRKPDLADARHDDRQTDTARTDRRQPRWQLVPLVPVFRVVRRDIGSSDHDMICQHDADVQTRPVAQHAREVRQRFVELAVAYDRKRQEDGGGKKRPNESRDGTEERKHGLEVQPDAVDRSRDVAAHGQREDHDQEPTKVAQRSGEDELEELSTGNRQRLGPCRVVVRGASECTADHDERNAREEEAEIHGPEELVRRDVRTQVVRDVGYEGRVGDDEAGDDGGETEDGGGGCGGLVRCDVQSLRSNTRFTDEYAEADERGKPEESFEVVQHSDAAERHDQRDHRRNHNPYIRCQRRRSIGSRRNRGKRLPPYDRVEDTVAQHRRQIEQADETRTKVPERVAAVNHLPHPQLRPEQRKVRREDAAEPTDEQRRQHGGFHIHLEQRHERPRREGEHIDVAREPDERDAPPVATGSFGERERSDGYGFDAQHGELGSEHIELAREGVGLDGSFVVRDDRVVDGGAGG
ncbi:THO complex subunit 2 [Pseudozyma hubeiensis SY62]|uniref:THO complex subunit 2 n=1 Tax=Pseudozyma hubeiensis (strain SY62) TaxID=1305764 RepID=R9PFA2_PSEHS|nr:THO complex subunit 2 [Pseudozyma hubeiensis SY62]GAC99912.1 THO complex subunit 2 [Pseudozyma hubeiensis SY62]